MKDPSGNFRTLHRSQTLRTTNRSSSCGSSNACAGLPCESLSRRRSGRGWRTIACGSLRCRRDQRLLNVIVLSVRILLALAFGCALEAGSQQMGEHVEDEPAARRELGPHIAKQRGERRGVVRSCMELNAIKMRANFLSSEKLRQSLSTNGMAIPAALAFARARASIDGHWSSPPMSTPTCAIGIVSRPVPQASSRTGPPARPASSM